MAAPVFAGLCLSAWATYSSQPGLAAVHSGPGAPQTGAAARALHYPGSACPYCSCIRGPRGPGGPWVGTAPAPLVVVAAVGGGDVQEVVAGGVVGGGTHPTLPYRPAPGARATWEYQADCVAGPVAP